MVEFYFQLKLILRIIAYLTYILCWEIDNFVIKSDIFRRFFICKNILKKLSCYHRIRRYSRSVTLVVPLLFYVHENFNSLTPSWLVQPEVFIRFWYVQSAGCTRQDGVIDDESLVKRGQILA